ncbi:MAG: EAL domain-containing protein [Candidatus Wallacebacter cryptica]
MPSSHGSENQYLMTLLNTYEPRYSSFFHNNPYGMFCCAIDTALVEVNAALVTFSGFNREELLNTPLTELIISSSQENFATVLTAVKQGCVKRFHVGFLHKDGRKLAAEMTAIPIFINKKVVGIHGIIRDVSGELKTEKSPEEIKFYDPLTKLPNRILLYQHLQQLISKGVYDGVPAVFALDLDRFKVINDSLGRDLGDHLLCQLTDRMGSQLKPSDFLARLAGDEFVIVVKRNTRNDLEQFCQTLLHQIAAPIEVSNQRLTITASAGICLLADVEPNADAAIRCAGIALYQAKQRGRGSHEYYSPSLGFQSMRRIELEAALKDAFAQSQFLLHYQPQIDLELCRIVGVEALVRWNHPELGMVPPLEFIPLAEKTGMIVPLGEWILTAACQQFRVWLDQGCTLSRLSVNISVSQFNQSNFCDQVLAILEETGLDPGYLELEITESQLLNVEAVMNKIQMLRARGIKIAIDDFGTGYSPLSHLRQISIDTLKIDKGFIQEISYNTRDRVIVQTIISMARMMRLNLIAEGVETHEQLQFLGQYSLREVQGYYFSPPLPNYELEKLLARSM